MLHIAAEKVETLEVKAPDVKELRRKIANAIMPSN
jgi:hypothetical protein